MLLQEGNWLTGYQQLMADCRPSSSSSLSSSGTVLILCNPDADALCAARILRCVLRADNIPFQLRPCGGMRKLVSILESLNLYSANNDNNNYDSGGRFDDDYNDSGHNVDSGYDNDFGGSGGSGMNMNTNNSSIRVIILLNLGATKNLNKTLYSPRPIHDTSKLTSNNPNDPNQSDNEENDHDHNDEDVQYKPPLISSHIKTFVLDSHRPYHLANIHAGKNIVLWNDYDHWHEDEGGIPSDGEGLSGDEEEDEDDSDDSDSDDSDSDDDEDSDEDSDEGEAEFKDEDDMKGNYDEPSENIDDDSNNGDENVEVRERNALKRSKSSSSSQDDVNDDDSNSSPIPNKRPRQDDPDTPNTQVMTDDENNPSQASEHNAPNVSMISLREQHEQRRNRIRNYYRNGSFYSSPVSFMAYILSTKLRHGSVGDLLWLACVGVTDAYIHNRLELGGYINFSINLQDRIRNMYDSNSYIYKKDGDSDSPDTQNSINHQLQNTFHAEELYTTSQHDLYGSGGDGGSVVSANYNGPMTKVGFSDNGKIIIQKDEFRFFLLRHISLWDAMVLSSEVNTKMELWKNSGIKKLQEMLAKMGVPLTQCQQPYAFMKPTLKRRLKMVIEEHAEVSLFLEFLRM